MGRKRTAKELAEERDRLNERIREARARESERARKQRTHALVTYGGMVEEAAGGDWTAIDPWALHRLIAGNGSRFMQVADGGRTPDEASEAVRRWSREYRAAKRGGARATEGGGRP